MTIRSCMVRPGTHPFPWKAFETRFCMPHHGLFISWVHQFNNFQVAYYGLRTFQCHLEIFCCVLCVLSFDIVFDVINGHNVIKLSHIACTNYALKDQIELPYPLSAVVYLVFNKFTGVSNKMFIEYFAH